MRMRILAADVGGTYLRVALFRDGEMLRKVKVTTPRGGGKLRIAEEIYNLAMDFGVEVDGAGVAVAGVIDVRSGDVAKMSNSPIKSFPLRGPLEERLSVPVVVLNDCVAAAWGEHITRGIDNLVYLTLSTGIGAGAVVNGSLLLGKDGNAHEVGHMTLDYRGRRCGCGGRGHWEAMASGSAIPSFSRELALEWDGARTEAWRAAMKGELDPPALFSLWREGDEFAGEVVSELAKINAAGISSVINVYDPEMLVLGGSIALNNRDFVELFLRSVDEYLINRMPLVDYAIGGEDAVLRGAAISVLRRPKALDAILRSPSRR